MYKLLIKSSDEVVKSLSNINSENSSKPKKQEQWNRLLNMYQDKWLSQQESGTKSLNNNTLNKQSIRKLGAPKHNSPLYKEWRNGVYYYNNNYVKSLPSLDNILNNLIKSYFTVNPIRKGKKLKMSARSKKRQSLNRVVTSNAEVKHSNNKITVIVSIFNKNKKFLLHRLTKLYKTMNLKIAKFIPLNRKLGLKHLVFISNNLAMKTNHSSGLNKISNINKKTMGRFSRRGPLSFKRISKRFSYQALKKNLKPWNKTSLINIKYKKMLKKIRKYRNMFELISVNRYGHGKKKKPFFFLANQKENNKNNYSRSAFLDYKNRIYKKLLLKSYTRERLFLYYLKALMLNNSRFKAWLLLGLKKSVSNLYNKKIEFDVINLKYFHLNSDILSEAMAVRLRDRNKRVLNVISKVLALVKLPGLTTRSLHQINTQKKIGFNDDKHSIYSSTLDASGDKKRFKGNVTNWIEPQNSRTGYGPEKKNISFSWPLTSPMVTKYNITKYNILDSIKYKSIFGVRFEAAGRLSKRLTASRSLYKFRYKGSIKNTYSSVRGKHSVILRGNITPNVQYTLINSKTRNGSFGLKGWVSGS